MLQVVKNCNLIIEEHTKMYSGHNVPFSFLEFKSRLDQLPTRKKVK